ncbi:ras guanyl-nucleotide exchange factor [Botrytis cinerea]
MDQVGAGGFPARTTSKRSKSSTPLRTGSQRFQRSARTLSVSPPSAGPSETFGLRSRPGLGSRTSSAPFVPLSSGGGGGSLGSPRFSTPIEDDTEEALDLHARSYRDSVASIKDDPFFRNYQSPHSVSLARELRSVIYSDRSHDDDALKNPPPRSNKRPSVESSASLIPPQSRSGMSDINIAVIGSNGVGKSTLIQRALGLRSLPNSIASSLRMTVDEVGYIVSLIELDLESFDIVPDRRIQWPKQINGHIVPRMDGALLLYDVMNRESITELPQTLNALVNLGLPTILVSCKCDNPEHTRQLNVDSLETACMSCVESVKTAANVPESARLCLSSMLRAVMANRSNNHNKDVTSIQPQGTRRRATSSANIDKLSEPTIPRPLSQQSKHSRASSEFSIGRALPSPPLAGRSNGRTNLSHQIMLPDPHDAPPLSAHPAFRSENHLDNSGVIPRLPPGPKVHPALSPSTIGIIDTNISSDVEELDADSPYRYSDDIPLLQRSDDTFFDKPTKVAGVTFDDLVDRLLGQQMSKADVNFSEIFLCLYRKFAAPGELFDAVLSRLTHGFINQLASDPVFAAAAQEMRAQLQSRVVEDDDTGWARTDADVDNEQANESAPVSPTTTRADSKGGYETDVTTLAPEDDLSDMELKGSRGESLFSARTSQPDFSAPAFLAVEDYEKEAAKLTPKGILPLSKDRYHMFMEISNADLADEMTRIDWVMFSSIRLRDLVRHVSLSLNQKEKCKSLANVNRMINHFNHIAKWVANMILMRDKAKHRAQILEKFMNIALRLRQLNNYNGLAAVLAGINGTAIHRLTQTRNLVPADVQKRFARLVLLMGTQKSHFAYRLAWENSPLPRIPFIPLTRRDLVSAEEGSRTFVGANGERINWKKFEVLSEVILPIMKSQTEPYPKLIYNDKVRELILDCLIPTDDEDIYQRSLQVESASGAAEPVKKKFPWFSKDK